MQFVCVVLMWLSSTVLAPSLSEERLVVEPIRVLLSGCMTLFIWWAGISAQRKKNQDGSQ